MQRELTDRPWHRQDDLGYTYSFTEILRQTFPPSSNAADVCGRFGTFLVSFDSTLTDAIVCHNQGSSGHGLYFALRSPTYPFYYIQEHWISYNACPIKVQWSKDIPLSPPTGLDGDYKRWAVALTSMNIVKVESAGRTVVIPGGELFQSSHGTGEVLFDTGSSLTYVPDHVIEHLRTVTFKCPENGENENEQGHVTRDEDRPAFVVPDRLVSPTEGLWIELVFVGMAEQPVKVYVLMDPFLCARNPTSPGTSREGLWCSGQSLPRPLKPTEMIFGLVCRGILSYRHTFG
ncbi:hypothetical protein FKP32DRAFT_1654164 [Trametes sanguinea]|nr:hypothetical protein FKP32DRAFT_1654164 [Trametes sanguinea]